MSDSKEDMMKCDFCHSDMDYPFISVRPPSKTVNKTFFIRVFQRPFKDIRKDFCSLKCFGKVHMNVCKKNECDEPIIVKGLCKRHYESYRIRK